MKVASWNVNSVRTRLEHIIEFLKTSEVDVLCLQELKCQDCDFPAFDFQALGYECYIYGQKAYNGVAILTKLPAENVEYGFSDNSFDEQKRLIKATIGGFDVYNIYAPNGSDPESDKFAYKEGWFLRLRRLLKNEAGLEKNKIVVCGDYNIAPTDDDVVDPKKSLGRIGFHPEEHKWFAKLVDLGMTDTLKVFDKTPKLFTWWNYRFDGFKKDRGMRIDHFMTNDNALANIANCYVDKTPRGWEKPSDHTPIIIETK